MPLVLDLAKYPLPSFLEGRCAPPAYCKWLHAKANGVLTRDKRRRKAFALTATKAVYKEKIHKAVTDGGEYDPYTGERLAWELVSTWDSSHSLPKGRLDYFNF